ncbi:MAG: hypothetical protein ACD_58C00095G0001 [uncultured bacterium]|nr:MAG: hypothetical protein ACD_58C00095G0001 [uncultured bacterium]
MINTVSKNKRKRCWVLKCDIKKFFDSVDQEILFEIIKKKIKDNDFLRLISGIIKSYPTNRLSVGGGLNRKGIPLGNLTSQLFVNIYLNELDQFIKHRLSHKKAIAVNCDKNYPFRYYLRYSDDFILITNNENCLKLLIPRIQDFLKSKLKLELHPNKISIRKYTQGIDYLGYVVLSKYRLVRTKTKRRIYSKLKKKVKEFKSGLIKEATLKQSLNSYLGVLSHANSYELEQDLLNHFWFWMKE